jgi:multiple sugar transport system substrate-binding protein
MSGSNTRPSPSPSEVGFSVFSRRQMLLGAAGAVGAAGLLAACGSDDSTDSGTEGTDGAAAETTAAGAETTAAAGGDTGGGTATGEVSFGSNYSDTKDSAAVEAMMAAFPNKDVTVKINTTDHNSYQENISTYLQQPDDVLSWFAGYRMRFFASQGLVGDISDVWANLTELSEGFKTASTGDDGKQYFVPLYYYPWAVHYRKSLFEEKGYTVPTKWDEFVALAEQMKTDGLTPLVAANDGKWPQMGMFDQLNLRINGYDFHVSLMAGNESWEDDKVKAVFTQWEQLLPLQQEGANGRTWQEGANALGDKSAGMYLLGTFVTSNFDPATNPDAQSIIDDIDFFAFPEINAEHGQDAVEAPIDGFMMAAKPKNEAGAKELLGYLGTGAAAEAFLAVNPASVAASSKASTANYTAIQKKSAEFVGGAKFIAQFLDRDTNPEFAANVMGDAIANFINDPSQLDSILTSVEEQKKTIFTS